VPSTALPASFIFQTTNPQTNQLTGTPNTPVNIPAGATQTYVFGFTPSAPFASSDVALEFTCANTLPAPVYVGLNTLLTTASATPLAARIIREEASTWTMIDWVRWIPSGNRSETEQGPGLRGAQFLASSGRARHRPAS
jgi:hypothetical protein